MTFTPSYNNSVEERSSTFRFLATAGQWHTCFPFFPWEALVYAGFTKKYYPEYKDMVMCRECGLWLSDWKKQALPLKQISEYTQAVPLGEHQRYSPDCPFVKAHAVMQATVSATPQATQRFAPGGISQWCNTEAIEAGLKASKQQAEPSLQDMWEQYKQKYMTPAKTATLKTSRELSKSASSANQPLPQSAAQATSQLAP